MNESSNDELRKEQEMAQNPETPEEPEAPETDTGETVEAEEGQESPLVAVAEMVRQETRAGNVLRLEQVWAGTEEEYVALFATPEAAEYADIKLMHDADQAYLYSEEYMTSQYALLAARSKAGNPLRLIAETVRSDSEVYPRPTPVDVFGCDPFLLGEQDVSAAIEQMAIDKAYEDIKLISASDGSKFLYSSAHLHPDLAQALAEWDAVGRFTSP